MSGQTKEPRVLIEEIAEDVVMLDLKDLPGLAMLTKRFRAVSEPLAATNKVAAGAALAMGELVEKIILEEVPDAVRAWDVVVTSVSALQGCVAGRRDTAFPAELGLVTGSAPTPASERTPGSDDANRGSSEGVYVPPPGVDEDILKAFVDQQLSVLPEIEALILSLESGGNGEQLAALRRIVHTMKGEAGVVGVNEIQRVCHAMEDHLGTGDKPASTDVLLKVKDWIADSVACMAGGQPLPKGDAVIALLDRSVSTPVSPPSSSASSMSPASPTTETPKNTGPSAPSPAESEASSSSPGIAIGDPDLTKDFVAESREHFDSADEGLLTLEREPGNTESVASVFRAFHTIKGVAGFLGLPPIADLAHAAETLLDDVRRGKRAFHGRVSDVTFAALDMLKALVADLGAALRTGSLFHAKPNLPLMIADLKIVISGSDAPLRMVAESSVAPVPVAPVEGTVGAESAVVPDHAEARVVNPAETGDGSRQAPRGEEAQQTGDGAIKQTVKVDADRLDLLIDNIGELVIAQSIVAQDPDMQSLRSLRVQKNLSHLTKITRTLQDMGMSMRMTPIEPTFRKMARLVRDLAKKANKEVEFTMVGKETELDRGMVEKLGDPLVHMIRNSVDHGIEATVEERRAAGKNPVGHVTLRAYHKGGSIHIGIEDDGRGLNRDVLVAKAIERGMIKPENHLTDQEAYALIFAAGFSTAKQVTEISGRGVGMDVVRRNIESLRGKVLIDTVLGKGTTFTLVLPLTTAIIDGMLVKVSSEVYVLPTLSIIESLRPTPQMISTVTGKGEMVAFRGALLSLFRLSDIFHVSGATVDPSEAIVMVVEESGKRWGLLVDEILGQQQIVIKSLGETMGHVPGISGVSVMADGRPGLILDIAGVIKLATE